MAVAGPEAKKGMQTTASGNPLTIVSIGGQPVVGGTVDGVDASGPVQIVVDEDPSYLLYNEQLTLTDEGPRGPTPAATPRKKGDHPKARLKSKTLKTKWPKGQMSTAGGTGLPILYYELVFEVAAGDLTSGEKYTVYATADSYLGGSYQSDTVTFTTK
jgi:hypothetical protein